MERIDRHMYTDRLRVFTESPLTQSVDELDELPWLQTWVFVDRKRRRRRSL